MELYPALDVAGGRLARAGPAGADPLHVLTQWRAAGARWAHVVDLDRVFGRGENGAVIAAALAVPGLWVQVGGGLGDATVIDDLVARGARRVVIGAACAVGPARLEALLTRHGTARIAVSLDVRAGRVVPRGGPPLDVAAVDLARELRARGVGTVVWTGADRDGSLAGPDLEGARSAAALGLDVIVGGGVGCLEDVTAARRAGLAGVIVGRALHEGRFSLAEALACVRS